MQLHEPVYMGSKPIDTVLHNREPPIHIFSEVTKLKMDKPKPRGCLSKSCTDKPLQSC